MSVIAYPDQPTKLLAKAMTKKSPCRNNPKALNADRPQVMLAAVFIQ